MQIWRPAQQITIKALGLHWRDGKILASEVRDDHGKLKGVRPLGGTVEFGESWQDTLVREFQEELGITIQITSAPLYMENIYVHHGQRGHEVIVLAQVAFPKGAFEGAREITFREDNETEHVARWYGLDELLANEITLYPTGLFDRVFGAEAVA